MHAFIRSILDILFPLSPDAGCVRDTKFETLAALCSPHTVGEITVLCSYRAPRVRAFLHETKFHRNERAIALLGQLLGEYLNESFPQTVHGKNNRELCLVPIPLSSKRLRERGYNQTLLIARAARVHAPHAQVHEELLKKIRHTPSQTSLSRAERLSNLDGVFAAGEHALPLDTPLILFDDIVTTGFTLAEAARALRRAGFTRIARLALAH